MNNMTKYDGVLRKPFLAEHWYKGFVASVAIWLPVFFMLAEIFEADMNIAAWIASCVSITIAIAVFTYHEGFELDTEKQQYRNYVWVLGLHFGQWNRLPVISHIVVRQYQTKNKMTVTDNSDPVLLEFVATERGWQVLLSVVGAPIGIIAAYATNTEAYRIANILSQILTVDITK